MMDGPGANECGMELQGTKLYPQPDHGLAAELHSAAKPEKLPEANRDTPNP